MAKAPKLNSQPQIVTANHLASGDVVYLSAARSWTREIGEAAIAPNAEAAAPLLAFAAAEAKRNVVVAPYLIPVDASVSPPQPVQFRERIRARGPTTVGPTMVGSTMVGSTMVDSIPAGATAAGWTIRAA